LKRFFQKLDYRIWLRYVVDHPTLVILSILLVTVLLGFKIPTLKIRASVYEVSVKNSVENRNYQRFLKEFGSGEFIEVMMRAENIFDPASFAKLTRLSKKLSALHGVIQTVSLPEIKDQMDLLDEWSLAEFEAKIAPADLFERNIISRDRKSSAIILILRDIHQEEEVVDAVDKILSDEAEEGYYLYQIGMPLVSQALIRSIRKDFSFLPLLALALMVGVLVTLFRSWRMVIPPLSCIVTALAWTFGVMAWTDKPVSALSLIVPIFILAVGTAYCLHVLAEYQEEAKTAGNSAEAAYSAMRHLRLPTVLAVVTTLIGFSVLLMNRTEAIRAFATPACVGMASLMVLILFLFPAILALLPLPKIQTRKRGSLVDGLLRKIIAANLKYRKTTLTVLALVALAAALGIPRIRLETNPTTYFKKSVPVTQHFHDVYQDMSGSFPVNIVVDSGRPGYFLKPENLAKMAHLQEYLVSIDGIDKTISFADYMKLIRYSANDWEKVYYALPETETEGSYLTSLYQMMLGPEMANRFITPDYSKANIFMLTHMASSSDWLAAESRIENYWRTHYAGDFDLTPTSMGVVVAHSNKTVTLGLVRSLFYTVGIVLAIMFILFMSAKAALVTLLPNLFPVLISFAVMGWMGIELSMTTGVIATIAIGLAIDDTIHYMVRYNREFRRDLDERRALTATLSSVGRPMVFTTITIVLGFSVLTFSDFVPTATFGGLMIVTMVSALVGDTLLLPSFMLRVELVTIWDLLRVKLGKDPVKGFPLFSGLSRPQIHSLLLASAIKEFPGGEINLPEVANGASIWAVVSGEVVMFHTMVGERDSTLHGSRVRIATLGPGDVIGETGSDSWHGTTITLMARSRTELLQINARVIRRLQWLYPPTANKFIYNLISVISSRLKQTTEVLAGPGYLDDVTGLANRPTFTQTLVKELSRAARYGHPISVLVVEIANLKDINVREGFHTGDRVLALAAKLMAPQIRGFDTMCRLDESRFALLLIRTGPQETDIILSRLLSALENDRTPESTIHWEIRSGAAVYEGGEEETAESLLERAILTLEADGQPGQPGNDRNRGDA